MGDNTASHASPPEGVVSNGALTEQRTNETHQATKMARGGAVLCRLRPPLPSEGVAAAAALVVVVVVE